MGTPLQRRERIVERGDWGTVEYAIRQNGDTEAKEWMDRQSMATKSSFAHLFRTIAAGQKIHNKTQFRHLRDQIWEFKRGGNRILAFRQGNAWFLTHHYSKGGSRKCPRTVMDRAQQIRSECILILKKEDADKR